MAALRFERVVLGFDPTGENRPALRAAARMASHWHARLHGVYVEDIGLLDAATLPISKEVLSLGGISTPLDVEQVMVQIKALASRARDWLAAESDVLGVEWSFEVARGRLSPALFPAEAADFLILEGTSRPFADRIRLRSHWSGMLSSIDRPIMLFRGAPPSACSVAALPGAGSDEGRRVLDTAELLATERGGSLIVFARDRALSPATAPIPGAPPVRLEPTPQEPNEIYRRARELGCGLLVIGAGEPCLDLLLNNAPDDGCSLMIIP